VGTKLVGSSASGLAAQGYAVALSADAHTALIGGYGDHGSDGATWVFTGSSGGGGGRCSGERECIIPVGTPDPSDVGGRGP
jgi:hypothetical protein